MAKSKLSSVLSILLFTHFSNLDLNRTGGVWYKLVKSFVAIPLARKWLRMAFKVRWRKQGQNGNIVLFFSSDEKVLQTSVSKHLPIMLAGTYAIKNSNGLSKEIGKSHKVMINKKRLTLLFSFRKEFCH